jgi:cell division protein FtsW
MSDSLTLRGNGTAQGLLAATLAMLGLGVVMVHSAMASVLTPGAWYSRVDVRHTAFAAASGILLALIWRLDYRSLNKGKRFPVVPTVLLLISVLSCGLVFVPGIGHSVGGDARWIRLGPAQYSIGFQPSELVKLALPIFMAAWLSREGTNPRSFFRTFLPMTLLIGLCVGAVVTQDFSVAAIIGLTAVATLILAGVPWWMLASLIPPAVAAFYVFVVHSPHRWARMTVMLDPMSPTNPSAYQTRESLLAILSGGWIGRGLGGGMIKLGFLPEDTTDFIFSVFCEEWGFVGAILLIALVMAWTWNVRQTCATARDRFGYLLAGSLGFLIVVQIVLHIAVDTVAVPPTGTCLPFFSAGGTALLLTAVSVGFILSVAARRKES